MSNVILSEATMDRLSRVIRFVEGLMADQDGDPRIGHHDRFPLVTIKVPDTTSPTSSPGRYKGEYVRIEASSDTPQYSVTSLPTNEAGECVAIFPWNLAPEKNKEYIGVVVDQQYNDDENKFGNPVVAVLGNEKLPNEFNIRPEDAFFSIFGGVIVGTQTILSVGDGRFETTPNIQPLIYGSIYQKRVLKIVVPPRKYVRGIMEFDVRYWNDPENDVGVNGDLTSFYMTVADENGNNETAWPGANHAPYNATAGIYDGRPLSFVDGSSIRPDAWTFDKQTMRIKTKFAIANYDDTDTYIVFINRTDNEGVVNWSSPLELQTQEISQIWVRVEPWA